MTLLEWIVIGKALSLLGLAILLFRKRQRISDFVMHVFGPEPDQMTLRCGWCKDIIRRGAPGQPISDGLCATCRARLEQDAVDHHDRRRLNSVVKMGGRGGDTAA